MNLNLEKHVDNVVFGEIFDSNDLKNRLVLLHRMKIIGMSNSWL